MEIISITTIKLEDAEKSALQTLRDAYRQCFSVNCFECDKCPLFDDDTCIGLCADNALEKYKRR